MLAALAEQEHLDGIQVQTGTLEDVFLSLTGREYRHEAAQRVQPLSSLAIVRGFLRDRASVFFAIVFPLMFLVLFGGLFADQSQSKVDMMQVGDVSLLDEMPEGARAASTRPSTSPAPTTSTPPSPRSRKGDADVAVEMQGDTLVAHYTQTDQVKAAVTAGRAPGLRRRHQRRACPAGPRPTGSRPSGSRTTR